MRTIAAAAAVLLLAACSSGGSGNNSSGMAATTQPEAPVNLTVDQSNMAVPVAAPSATPIAGLPKGFDGHWGVTAADCAAKAAGSLTISGDRLAFGDKGVAATNVRRLAPDAIAFELPADGGGPAQSTRLSLGGDGRSLIRQVTTAAGKASGTIYQRCPSA